MCFDSNARNTKGHDAAQELEQRHTIGSSYSVVLHIPKKKCNVCIAYHVSSFVSKTVQAAVQNNSSESHTLQ